MVTQGRFQHINRQAETRFIMAPHRSLRLTPRAGAASQFPFLIKAMPAEFPNYRGTLFVVVQALEMPVTELKNSDYSTDVKDHVPIDDEHLRGYWFGKWEDMIYASLARNSKHTGSMMFASRLQRLLNNGLWRIRNRVLSTRRQTFPSLKDES